HGRPLVRAGADVTVYEPARSVEVGKAGMVGHRGSWARRVTSPPLLSAGPGRPSSRVASSTRSWRLRGSGEGLPLRRSDRGSGRRLSRAVSAARPGYTPRPTAHAEACR